MALRMKKEELQSFIPSAEQDSDKPTTVWGVPLDAKGYEKYTDELVDTRGGKTRPRTIHATENLIRKTVAKLENIYDTDGVLLPEVTNSERCVGLLLGLQDVNSYNEIMNWLKGISLLDEGELKNSEGPQGPDSSGVPQKRKKAQ